MMFFYWIAREIQSGGSWEYLGANGTWGPACDAIFIDHKRAKETVLKDDEFFVCFETEARKLPRGRHRI